MNRDEAKVILLLYRPGLAEAEDPQIAGALALAKTDPELARWLEEHIARQNVLREKFRQIAVPDGLKEQIISEQAARAKTVLLRRNFALAAAAIIIALMALAPFILRTQRNGDDNTLDIYQGRMAGIALRGYAMDLETNDVVSIRAYLEQKHAPSGFILPTPLQQVALAGCAVQSWQAAKVSMVCFRTGRPLPSGTQSDLWLFVVDRASVKNVPATGPPQFEKVSQLATAVWVQDGKLYLLGTRGDEALIRKFL